MEIRAEVTYTVKMHRTLAGVSLFRRGDPKHAILRNSILTLLIIAAALFMDFDLLPVLGILIKICAGVSAFCMLLILLQYCLLPYLNYKKAQKKGASAVRYCFTEAGFTVDATETGSIEHYEKTYDSLCRIIETEELFFLYINQAAAFIVEKASLTGGTAAQLRDLLLVCGTQKYTYRKI